MRARVIVGLLLAVSSPARAGCDARTLMEVASRADEAFEAMQADVFSIAAMELDETLACGIDPLSPIQVVAYHRTKALAAFFDGDYALAILSFQAALATMPGYELPDDIAPPGHPLRELFEQAGLFAPTESVELPPPVEGWISIDGARTRVAPAGRPFVFQRLEPDGTVVETRYVPIGAPMPRYPAAEQTRTVQDLDGPQPKRINAPLVGAGIAMGMVAGGAYASAFVTRSTYDRAVLDGDAARIRSNYLATNGLVGGSIGLLALGTTFVLVGTF